MCCRETRGLQPGAWPVHSTVDLILARKLEVEGGCWLGCSHCPGSFLLPGSGCIGDECTVLLVGCVRFAWSCSCQSICSTRAGWGPGTVPGPITVSAKLVTLSLMKLLFSWGRESGLAWENRTVWDPGSDSETDTREGSNLGLGIRFQGAALTEQRPE